MTTDTAIPQIQAVRSCHLTNLLNVLVGQGFLCRMCDCGWLAPFLFLTLIYIFLQMKQRMKYRLSLTFAHLHFIRMVFNLGLREHPYPPGNKLIWLTKISRPGELQKRSMKNIKKFFFYYFLIYHCEISYS